MLKIAPKFKSGRINQSGAFLAELQEDGKLWSPYLNRVEGVLNADRTEMTSLGQVYQVQVEEI